MLLLLIQDLNNLSNPNKAQILQRFFKTGVGEYGEGDIFLGITVLELKLLAKKYVDLSFSDIKNLLSSDIHEQRYMGLAILKLQFLKSKDLVSRESIINFVKKNIKSINNWDLVDSFIPYVFGEYYFDKNRDDLYKYQKSDVIWERRIAILTTFYFLKRGDFVDILKLSELSLTDKHDLIHKACGWMLREVGKLKEEVLINFLDKNYKNMPRTMLRYSIERLGEDKRKYYLKK